MTSKAQNGRSEKEEFCTQSKFGCWHKLYCYIYKIFYISLMITRKQKPTAVTKDKKKGIKHTTMEDH